MSELTVDFSEMQEAPGIEFAELGGAIDASTVHIFQNQLEEARKRNVTKLIMDISKIKYVNSTGLGSLVKYADTFKASGGGIVLLRVPAKVKIVIEMLGLHEFFEMCSSEEEAIKVFGGAVAAPAPPPAAPAAKPQAPAAKPAPAPRPASRKIETLKPAEPQPIPDTEMPEPDYLEATEIILPAAKTAPPKPKPAVAPKPAAPKPAAPKTDFPVLVTCATCSIGVEVPESGNFKCPRCSTVLYVDGQGNTNFFAPKKPMPIQMTLISSPECTEGFLSFFNTMSGKLKLPQAETNKVVLGLKEVLDKIAQEAYLAKPSTYHLLFAVGTEELVIKTSDHGRLLNGADAGATFPVAAGSFDELEVTAHPKGGNVVRMVKKLS